MRLGLLGPAGERDDALERAAKFLVDEVRVDRAVYLAPDRGIDRVVMRWATDLVGGDPSDDAVWDRAVGDCLHAGPEAIASFIESERKRAALKVFESLPSEGTRAIEILDGKVLVMIYDKAQLDEEDILPASILAFGKSGAPVVKAIGQRWFLAPGGFDAGGILVLEDGPEGIDLALYDGNLKKVRFERLKMVRGTKMRVAGAG